MTNTKSATISAVSAFVLGLALLAPAPASAETVLRIDEHAIGEIDPAKATDYIDSILFYNLYDILIQVEPGKIDMQPSLAESWTISADGKTYTFKLRDDVKFRSGNALTSADVAFSYQRLMALGQGFSNLFEGWIDGVETPDALTVVFELTRPYAPFMSALTRLGIVDKTTVMANQAPGDFGEFGDYGQAYLSSIDAGSAAYQIDSHNPQELTVLRKSADYFLGVPAEAPDLVRVRYSIEPSTLRALMTKGELDIGDQWMAPEIKTALASEEKIGLGVVSGISSFYLKLNNQKAPLDDVHCRRAFAHAFDYDGILKQTQITEDVAFGRPAHGPLPVGVLGSDPSLPTGVFDLDKAREELAQCKYNAADHEIQLNWVAGNPIQERIQLMMQQNLGEIGFKSQITTTPWAMFTELATTPETTPHVSPINFILVTPDPDAMLFTMYAKAAAGTWASADWVDDEETERLIAAGRETTDPAEREAIYKELGRRLVDQQNSIFAYELVGVFPIRDVVAAPALQDPSKTYPVQGMNFKFREMTMK